MPTPTTPVASTATAASRGVVEELAAALSTTGALVGATAPDQWSAPTPCPGWDVHALTNHLVGGLRLFTAQLTGTDAGRGHEDDWLGDDPAAAHAGAAAAVLAAWRSPGALDRTITLSLGTVPARLGAVIELTEVVVHGADLAVATGREDLLDQGQAARLQALLASAGFDGYRSPGVFGPAVPAPAGAPAHVRLLAYTGRRVSR